MNILSAFHLKTISSSRPTFKIMRTTLLSMYFMLVCAICTSQDPVGYDTDQQSAAYLQKTIVTPPSAEAASLGEYGEYELNQYTGVPNITIPVYTMKGFELNVPINLSYNASGIKVAAAPTHVGAGFSLTGVPSISRSTIGKPDFKENYYSKADEIYEGLFQPNELSVEEINFLYAAANGNIETQPDQFHFTLFDRSGKFYITPYKTVIQKEYNDLLIIPTFDAFDEITSFKIVDEYGRNYNFSVTEQTNVPYNDIGGNDSNLVAVEGEETYNSTWYASTILSRDGVEKITYTYENIPQQTVSVNFDQYTVMNYRCCDSDDGNCPSPTIVNGGPGELPMTLNKRRPMSITCELNNTEVEKVEFDYALVTCPDKLTDDRQLEKLTISRKGGSDLIEFDFTYHCDSGRLMLGSLQQKASNGILEINPYEFTYYPGSIPSFNSNKIDHWGYNNGISGMLPTYNYNTGELNVLNRESNVTFMKIGTLNKIKYPTGGSVEFQFEANEITEINNANECELLLDGSNMPIIHETCDVSGNDCCNSDPADPDASETVDVLFINDNMINNGYLDITADYFSCSDYGQQFKKDDDASSRMMNDVFFEVEILSLDESISYGVYDSDDAGGNLGSFYNEKIKISDEFLSLVDSDHYKVRVKGILTRVECIWYNDVFITEEIDREVGGLRLIKQSVFDDASNSSSKILEKTYNYDTEEDISSGIVFSMPDYIKTSNFTQCMIAGFPDSNVDQDYCWTLSILSSSNSELGQVQGSHIGYSRVEENIILDFTNPNITNGRIVSHFSNATFGDDIVDPVFNGKLLKKELFSDSDLLVSESIYGYSTEDNSYLGDSIFYGYAVIPKKNQDNKIHFYFEASIGAYVFTQTENDIDPADGDGPIEETVMTKLHREMFKRHQEYRVYKTFEESKLHYYDDTGAQNTITTLNTFTYGSTDHIQMTKSSFINSDGKIYIDTFYYKDSYVSDFNVFNNWNTNNKILPAWQTEKYVHNTDPSNIIDGNQTTWVSQGTFSTPNKNYRREVSWINGNKIDDGWEEQYEIIDFALGSTLINTFQVDGWAVVHDYDWSPTGKLVSHTYGDFITSYAYDSNNDQLSNQTNINGTQVSYEYDNLLRLSKSTNLCTNEEMNYNYHYKDQPTTVGGTSSMNFIKTTRTYPKTIGGGDEVVETYQYSDGINRPTQLVRKNQSSDGSQDLIKAVAYDNVGRKSKDYEPFQTSNTDGNYFPISGVEYTEYIYDQDPLSRLISSTPPSWYTTDIEYGTNSIAPVPIFNYEENILYADNELNCTITTDPNGNKNIECSDKLGRSVYTARGDENFVELAETNYAYDEKNRLELIVPPGSDLSNPLNYENSYYGNDLLRSKKIPDQDTLRYAYDNRDLLRSWKDGITHWATEYDQYGRSLREGTSKATFTYGTNNSPNITGERIVNTYGTNINEIDQIVSQTNHLLSLDESFTTSYSYDLCGRLEFEQEVATLSDREDKTNKYFYDAINNIVLDSCTVANQITVVDSFIFDPVGRLSKEYNRINNDPAQLICEFEYTGKEQIKSESKGNGLQVVDYTYLPNQFLSSINSDVDPDLFYLKIYYDEEPDLGGGVSSLNPNVEKNGNILALEWKSQNNENASFYEFEYDYQDRITSGDYTEIFNFQGTLNQVAQDYYNTDYTYDIRGNITSLNRNSKIDENNFASIDDLSYSYLDATNTSNKLTSIVDQGVSNDTIPGYSAGTGDYVYDDNGNITFDPSKDANIGYNYLNLPDSISITADTNIQINYLYNASGELKRKIHLANDSIISSRDYYGGIEVENSLVNIVHFQGGYIRRRDNIAHGQTLKLSGQQDEDEIYCAKVIESKQKIMDGAIVEYLAQDSICIDSLFNPQLGSDFLALVDTVGCANQNQWVYHFTINDHLGNIRVVFTDSDLDGEPEIVENFNYYPFGLEFHNVDNAGLADFDYTYNGKEKQWEVGYLNYGARFYDAEIGKFMTVDPLAEDYDFQSPYAYAANNPILYEDIMGLGVETIYRNKVTDEEIEVTDGVDKTIEVNETDFETAVIFASLINPVEEDGNLHSESIVGLYNEFYDSVNSYDEISFTNVYDHYYGGPKLTSDAPIAGTIPGVGGFKKTATKQSSGWIASKIFGKLEKSIQDKLITAMKKGIVAPVNNSGIVKLTASQAKQYPGYTHKLKILGKGTDIRIYGTQGKNGHFFFDKLGKH